MIIWLASYPRSGNTFFRVILNKVFGIKTLSIYDDTSDIGADVKTADVVGHKFLPQDFDLNVARKSKKKYFIKTHELAKNFNLSDEDKVIYLIRDGRESSFSFIKYLQDFHNQNSENASLDVLYGDTSFGSWSEHVKQWSTVDRLVIKFEELIEDPIKIAKEVEIYVDIEIKNEKVPTFEQLRDINPKFFRSGKKDSWKKNFSKAEQVMFWSVSFNEMIQSGYINDVLEELVKSSYKKNIFENYNTLFRSAKQRYKEYKKNKQQLQQKEQQLTSTKNELTITKNELTSTKNELTITKNELTSTRDELTTTKNELIETQQQLNKVFNSKSYQLGSLFLRSVKKPYKLITFPINLIRILSK